MGHDIFRCGIARDRHRGIVCCQVSDIFIAQWHRHCTHHRIITALFSAAGSTQFQFLELFLKILLMLPCQFRVNG
ncbi:Uncharacterised protein [Vibrio cholerae]|nr:Uncharacterised protein [Vibrio cholerae]